MSVRMNSIRAAVVACSANLAMSPMSRLKATTFGEVFSSIRPASRLSPSMVVCSPIHSRTFGAMPRPGRRDASLMSLPASCSGRTARRSHARTDSTPVLLRKSTSSMRFTGIPASIKATCTGTSKAFTLESTAISRGLAPPSMSNRTRSVVY